MERFFSKKSVAVFLTTIILFGFFYNVKEVNAFLGNTERNRTLNPTTWSASVCNAESLNTISDNRLSSTQHNVAAGQNRIICEAKKAGQTKLTAEQVANMDSMDKLYNDAQATIDEANKQDSKGIFGQVWGGLSDIWKSGPIGIAGAIVAAFLEFIFVPIASFLVAIAGAILDFSVQYSIYGQGFVDMKVPIEQVWTLLRDTINISFIFVLLYAAIQQIVIGKAAKTLLVSVITSAVLINFSLFATKIVIDASNLVANGIYGQIAQGASSVNRSIENIRSAQVGAGINTSQIELSGKVMAGLGLVTMFDSGGAGEQKTAESLTGVAGVMNSAVRIALFLMTAWVFMMLSAIIVGRFVMLVFLMTLSPLGFVGETIPALGDASKWWRKTLFDQALVAPIMMFFLLLTLKLARVTGSSNEPALSMKFFFNYFLIFYMLNETVKQVKKLSGEVGQYAEKFAGYGKSVGMGLMTGGASLMTRGAMNAAASGLRGGVGGLANKANASKWGARLEAFSNKDSKFARLTGGALKGGLDLARTSSFDVRNIPGYNDNSLVKSLGGAGIKTGPGTGKGGYAGGVEAKTKAAGKEGEAKDRAAEARQKTFVDEEVTSKINAKSSDLQKQIENETDIDKKAALKEELAAHNKKNEIFSGKTAKEVTELVANGTKVDFSDAEKKVSDYRKKVEASKQDAEAKIAALKEKDSGLRSNMASGQMSDEAIADSQKTLDETQKEIDKINKEVADIGEGYLKEEVALSKWKEKVAADDQYLSEIREGVGSEGYVNAVAGASKWKANYADTIRNRISSSFGKGRENEQIARAANKEKSESDKAKEAQTKNNQEIAAEIIRQQKESGSK